MKRIILGIILLIMLLSLTGCDWQVNYNLAEQIEFLPESGADQYVMCNALMKSLQDIHFEKYAGKKVYLDVLGGTPYTQGVVKNIMTGNLHKEKAIILKRLSDDEKGRGLKEEPGDYQLELNILTCGVHSYDGIIRKNIVGLALVNLGETDKDGISLHFPGKLQRYHYEQLVFSTYFIVAVLALMVLVVVLLLRQVLGKSKQNIV
jgi:hypothetical protein